MQFKSYLLSLGISNPVTRETHGTGLKYHNELAKQLADVLTQPIEVKIVLNGFVMTINFITHLRMDVTMLNIYAC